MIPQLTIDRAKQITFTYMSERAKELKMSNYRIAKVSGISESTISRIFNGDHKNIELDTYLRLCGALKLRPYLVPAEDDENKMHEEHFN